MLQFKVLLIGFFSVGVLLKPACSSATIDCYGHNTLVNTVTDLTCYYLSRIT